MNKSTHFLSICIFVLLNSCSSDVENDFGAISTIEGKTLELSFPLVAEVQHGEYFEIDGIMFYHNKYANTEYIGEATPQVDDFAYKNKIDIQCTKNVAYVAPKKVIETRSSHNQIAMDLAMKLALQVDEKNQKIYHIDNGPALNFQGKIIIYRNDGNDIVVKKGERISLMAIVVE